MDRRHLVSIGVPAWLLQSPAVNIQAPGLGVAVGDRGYVLAAGGVLPGWLSVVSGMIWGRDRCAAGGAAPGSA